MPKPIFKPYSQNQIYLLPPNLEEMIEENHPVRVVNEIIDKIDIKVIERQYKGGGTSSYNPKMLLKVLVYGYLRNVYSSRKLEEMTKENIHMMWISGMSNPDHHTINRFRSERLKNVLGDIFTQIVLLLVEEGQLDIKEVYIDGTKIEANANRYTFIWGKMVKRNRERIIKQIKELWSYTQKLAGEEKEKGEGNRFEQIDPEKIKETIDEIDNKLKGKTISEEVRKQIKYGKRNWPGRMKKYKDQEEKLSGRNSCSSTDKDSTFMRMKENNMNKRQLKPAYNVQISSNNQYIVNYSIHQSPNDSITLPEHLDLYRDRYGSSPEIGVADAGYGSEENYQYMEDNQIEGYVKYSTFDEEQKKAKVDKKPFTREKLFYNEERDCYYCPMGQEMRKIGEKEKESINGYKKVLSEYQAANCTGCPVRGVCQEKKETRIITVSRKGDYFKKKVMERLLSEKGQHYRKRRKADVETIFGNIKENKGFKRFKLRGLEKVTLEFGLISIAHNISKYSLALS